MTATLRDQIMDELMEGPGTISDLMIELSAPHETIRRNIQRLEGEGLIYAVGATIGSGGRPHVVYDMVRTRRAA